MSFILNYPATCEDCDQPMPRGVEAGYVGDGLVHVPGCPPPTPFCPECFLQLPASGVCECQE